MACVASGNRLMPMAYFLGIDAGGTRTDCAIARDETILYRASAATIKILRVSGVEAERTLDELLRQVADGAGVPLNTLAATCAGVSGVTVPRVAAWVKSALQSRVSGKVIITGDEETALDGAFAGGPGVLAIAGTGSNFIARGADGSLVRVGGWGILANEGSGMWIGQRAVRSIFDAADRGETTLLLNAVLQAWKQADLTGLVDLSNQSPPVDYPTLSPVVAACAAQGDARAQQILEEAGRLLAEYSMLAARRAAGPAASGKLAPSFAFVGSVLARVPMVWEAMRATILQEMPGATLATQPADAVTGALWRARHA
jgi:glucosamine kinase